MATKKPEVKLETIPNKPPVRTRSTKPKSARAKITRAQAIKLFCVECMGYNRHFVKFCKSEVCPLWPYRSGSGYEDTQAPIYVPKEWPSDKLSTDNPPEDDR
jgi:hypothetical protein